MFLRRAAAVIVFLSVCIFSCGRPIEGEYRSDGDSCMSSLVVRTLGNGQYNIILSDGSGSRIDVLGKLMDKKISTTFGTDSIDFYFEEGRVRLEYRDKSCLYIRAE